MGRGETDRFRHSSCRYLSAATAREKRSSWTPGLARLGRTPRSNGWTIRNRKKSILDTSTYRGTPKDSSAKRFSTIASSIAFCRVEIFAPGCCWPSGHARRTYGDNDLVSITLTVVDQWDCEKKVTLQMKMNRRPTRAKAIHTSTRSPLLSRRDGITEARSLVTRCEPAEDSHFTKERGARKEPCAREAGRLQQSPSSETGSVFGGRRRRSRASAGCGPEVCTSPQGATES